MPFPEGRTSRDAYRSLAGFASLETSGPSWWMRAEGCRREAEVAWIQVGATDIYCQDVGQGQPLVLLHGMSSCAEAWFQQFEAFAPSLRVIAYDSVNHGHSSNSPRDAPEPDRVDELEGFLAALNLQRPILAGNSMGALTLLRWAVRHPGDAAALVPSGMGIGRFPDGRIDTRPLDPETLFLPAGQALTDGLRERDPLLYERYLRIRSTATRLEALRHPRARSMARPSREELDRAVASIRSPMQVIVGELDWLAPNARALAAAVLGAKLHVVPESPHNVYYETADEYNQVVSGFLAELGLMPALRGGGNSDAL
jgi:pimeloyl-ACP methyl ester carboxylesterase